LWIVRVARRYVTDCHKFLSIVVAVITRIPTVPAVITAVRIIILIGIVSNVAVSIRRWF